jgi:hypothetical protein
MAKQSRSRANRDANMKRSQSAVLAWFEGIVAGLVLVVLWPLAVPGQTIRGRVVDQATRQPLPGAAINLHAGGAIVGRTSADRNGFFQFQPGGTGEYQISVQITGYSNEQQSIRFDNRDLVLPAFVMRADAIPLDTLPVRARAGGRTGAAVGSSRRDYVLAGARLARLEQHGATPLTAVRELAAGLHVEEFKDRNGRTILCVESTRRISGFSASACQWPVIIIDGVQVTGSQCDFVGCQPQTIFRQLHLSTLESFEYMPPVEAGTRYGFDASASGALVVWTRGRGPHRDPLRDKKQ